MKRFIGRFSLALFIILTIVSCRAQSAEKVTVFAAASLSNALDEIAADFHKDTREINVIIAYASSSTLARQIEQGAPADIFISADHRWMNYLADKKGVINTSRVTLLANQLVAIAPIHSPLEPMTIDRQTDWLALLAGGRLSIGDPDHVPAGLYAKQALKYLGQWDTVLPNLARADNVRSALLLVERAETPLGIVYGSDAVVSNKVKVIGLFPTVSHDPVEYPLAIVSGRSGRGVEAFYHYLQSEKAKRVFVKYGFRPF